MGTANCDANIVFLYEEKRWFGGSPTLPSGKHTKNNGKSQFLMGKSTISMAMFNSFLYVYQRVRTNLILPCFTMFYPNRHGDFTDHTPRDGALERRSVHGAIRRLS